MNTANIFKWIFQFNFTRKYYFGLYKKLFRPNNFFHGQTAICNYDGSLRMKVDIDEWIQQHVYFFGLYDPVHINFIKTQLKPGDYFFDVGANVGCFSLAASLCVGDSGKVYAFEPIKKVYIRLNENIELNRIKNISTIPMAVYEKNTMLRIFLANQENLGMSSIYEHDAMSGEVFEIEAISLDGFMSSNDIKKADFVKIDIEGAELQALRGMVNTIRRHQPVFMVEISENVLKKESDRNQIFTFFDGFNYSAFIVSDEGALKTPDKEKSGSYTNYIFKPSPEKNKQIT